MTAYSYCPGDLGVPPSSRPPSCRLVPAPLFQIYAHNFPQIHSPASSSSSNFFMGEVQRQRFRDEHPSPGQVAVAKDLLGRKKPVFLQMSYLVNMVMRQINCPEMKRRIYPFDETFSSVSVSYEVSKLDMQIKSGTPDLEVLFFGSKNISVEKSEHDAVRKLARYLMEKFRFQIVDWNYQKLCLTEMKLLEIDSNIKVRIGNIEDMLDKWKVSVVVLAKMQSDLASSDNILDIAVSGKLTTIKFMLEATFQHISYWMAVTLNQYAQYRKYIISTDFAEDVTTIKIPETEMFTDILLALGLKVAKINHTLEENDMFRGICKFKLPISGISKDVGKTIILGDLKKSASEAECSAAAQSIRYLERTLDLEVVDLSLPSLVEKEESLKHLLSVQRTYLAIEQHVLAKWTAMVRELKGLVNSQYTVCCQMGFEVDEHDRIHCADSVEESIGDIILFYDFFSTIGLDQP